jgi:hypothetical protein
MAEPNLESRVGNFPLLQKSSKVFLVSSTSLIHLYDLALSVPITSIAITGNHNKLSPITYLHESLGAVSAEQLDRLQQGPECNQWQSVEIGATT